MVRRFVIRRLLASELLQITSRTPTQTNRLRNPCNILHAL